VAKLLDEIFTSSTTPPALAKKIYDAIRLR